MRDFIDGMWVPYNLIFDASNLPDINGASLLGCCATIWSAVILVSLVFVKWGS